MARLARRVVRYTNFRVILLIMGLQVWLAGLPGLAAAALLGYLSQRHLQRLAVENGHKADLYLDLVTLLRGWWSVVEVVPAPLGSRAPIGLAPEVVLRLVSGLP